VIKIKKIKNMTLDLATISQLAGAGLVATLLVSVLKNAYKGLSDRYGALISQVVLLIVSVLIALAGAYIKLLPANVLEFALGVFASAMALYEIAYKAIFEQAIKGK
jgi:hypothetical protein